MRILAVHTSHKWDCSEAADTNRHFLIDAPSPESQGSWKHSLFSFLLSAISSFLFFISAWILQGFFPLATPCLLSSLQKSPLKSHCKVTVAWSLGGLHHQRIHLAPEKQESNSFGRNAQLLVLCGSKLQLKGLWISYQFYSLLKTKKVRRDAYLWLICAWLIPASDRSSFSKLR